LNRNRSDYLKDIRNFAVELHNTAIECEDIKLIGDYDADGICASLILKPYLEETTGKKVTVVIPDRYTDGYGIPDVSNLNLNKGTLVVTVDNGIEQTEKIDEIARITGNKVFVIDHHNYDKENVSENSIVLDFHENTLTDVPDYCGTGLAYLIAQQSPCSYEDKLQTRMAILSCIGTVADMVKVKNPYDYNREIILNGFETMKAGKNLDDQLKMFLDGCGTFDKKYITTSHIGFDIAPVINATGRLVMNGGQKVFDALDHGTKDDIDYLFERNEERKSITNSIYASKELAEQISYDKPNVLFFPSISEGICGLVATKVVERTGMPCLVFTEKQEEQGRLVGSGRNKEGYQSLYEALKSIDIESFKYGGHADACGFSLDMKDKDKLIEQFSIEKTGENLKEHNFIENPKITPDELYALEPFGVDNPVPEVDTIVTVDSYKNMGKDPNDPTKKNPVMASTVIDGVTYKTFTLGDKFAQGEQVRVKGTLGINEFAGRCNVEVTISEVDNLSRNKDLSMLDRQLKELSEQIDLPTIE